MLLDLRQALRVLLKAPGFSALVVAVLAMGIGANTAIFSIVNGVLLKPLAFHDARRLVAIDTTVRNEPDGSAYLDVLDWRAQTKTLDRVAAYTTAAVTITGTGDAVSVPSAIVTSDLFPMLGIRLAAGRVFTAGDDKQGAERTVIISDRLWTERFSRDPAVAGRAVTIDGDPFVVIGVAPADFEFPFDAEDPPQVWMPVMASRFAAEWAGQRAASFVKAIGHLRPGVDLATAQAELSTIAAQLARQYPRNGARGILVRPFQDMLVQNYRLGLAVLLGAVAAVLLIACANIANLLLARGSTRRREFAIRAALGASRGRIVRQLLGESAVLAAAGGIAGIVLALWSVDVLVRLSPLQIPRLHAVRVDTAALAFTAIVSVLTGVLSGIVPAFQISRADTGDALKDGERGGRSGRGTRIRQSLVVAEMAISLVLLASAGLLVRTLVRLQHVNPGFVTERAISMQLLLPRARYAQTDSFVRFYRRLHDEVRSLPGATSAAVSTTLPMSGDDVNLGITVEGQPRDPNTRTGAPFFGVSPDYFSTMGIPVLKGRVFTDRDDEQAPLVLVVSASMAAKYWPTESPIGKRITIGYNNTGPREIVGVVGDVKQNGLADKVRPQLYAPFAQAPWPFIAAVVRTTAAPEAIAGSLRAALARIDPLLGVGDIKTLDQFVARSVAAPRFTALLVTSFASMALVLAGFGLFSVTAYSVAQRRREIGIRMALGARASDVRALVLWQALGTAAAGLALGLSGALLAARVLDALLFGVTTTDPMTFASAPALLLGVALVAAYLPARRATRIDPMIALRTD